MPNRSPALILIAQTLALTITLPWLIACSTPSKPAGDRPVSTQSSPDPQIIALINGSPITRSQIEDDLSERAGKQALIDLILDHQLEIELSTHQITLTQSDIDHEAQLFLDTIADHDPEAPRYQLLESLRASKGLGSNRYPRFLRRNAALRVLVRDQSTPTQTQFDLSESITFGPRYQLRLLVTRDQHIAIALRERILAADPISRRWILADACSNESIHPSAPRGGLIPDLSADDPSYPIAITDAIRDARPGDLSAILSIEQGFALVLVEAQIPAITPTPSQIQSLRDQLTHRKELLNMQRLADDLLADARVSVLDRALNWAWSPIR